MSQRSATAHCPGCGKAVAPGTAVCPGCHVVLSEEQTASVSAVTERRQHLSSTEVIPEESPASPAAAPSAVIAAQLGAQFGGPSEPPTQQHLPSRDTVLLRRKAPPLNAPQTEEIPRPPVRSFDEEESISTGILAPVSVDFFRGLALSDQLALSGAVLSVVACLLPWKQTADEGDLLGLTSLGFPFFLGSLLCLGALWMRLRPNSSRMHPVIPWLAQLGTACFCVLWCFVFIRLSWNTARIADAGFNLQLPTSRPVFGVYLALLTSATALAGTLLGLRDKPL